MSHMQPRTEAGRAVLEALNLLFTIAGPDRFTITRDEYARLRAGDICAIEDEAAGLADRDSQVRQDRDAQEYRDLAEAHVDEAFACPGVEGGCPVCVNERRQSERRCCSDPTPSVHDGQPYCEACDQTLVPERLSMATVQS